MTLAPLAPVEGLLPNRKFAATNSTENAMPRPPSRWNIRDWVVISPPMSWHRVFPAGVTVRNGPRQVVMPAGGLSERRVLPPQDLGRPPPPDRGRVAPSAIHCTFGVDEKRASLHGQRDRH